MDTTGHEWHWLDAGRTIDQDELSRVCGLSIAELDELVDYGTLIPWESDAVGRLFSAACVVSLREAARLRERFDLDLFTAGLLFDYMQRIVELEHEVHALRAHATHPALPGEA